MRAPLAARPATLMADPGAGIGRDVHGNGCAFRQPIEPPGPRQQAEAGDIDLDAAHAAQKGDAANAAPAGFG